MSVILQVEYVWDVDWSTAEQPGAADAHAMREAPGLQWKIWLRDPDTRSRGGIYLFADRESAQDWADRIDEGLPGNHRDLSVRIFEINEDATRVTHGPLDIPAAVPSLDV